MTKVALVTGATGAIGKAIARQIASAHHEVVLTCRNEQKGAHATKEIIESTGNSAVRYQLVDCSSRESILELADRWTGPLDLLVNNAAETPRRRRVTEAGLEVQFATNIMGYFWFINAFTEALMQSAPSRVVNVASYWAGGLDLSDLQFERRSYNNDAAYRQSKQANRMLTVAHAERLSPDIAVNVCHPGDVNSRLSNDLGFGGHETPDQGAETPVWLATTPVGIENTGKYFEHLRESHCSFANDRDSIEALYEACSRFDQ